MFVLTYLVVIWWTNIRLPLFPVSLKLPRAEVVTWSVFVEYIKVNELALPGVRYYCRTSGFRILHCLPEFAQTHVHWVNDALQPSHPLSPSSSLALNLFQHQGLFQRVSSLCQVAKVLVLQLQHQSFQWIFRFDFL